ncbi:hypothetical protein [Pseudomonas chlororaphis]|uniref:Hemagglutinin protein n=1 Tax=Pseudomonas chlororaphis TaxID=587753 RepID=A0A1Q8ER89_9PSED|nr:hypothetical protein [Pseudomonas chlororaphis]OLF54322.1 hypothetical protein BTN82_14860 [Pseudomonas chlororaphis]
MTSSATTASDYQQIASSAAYALPDASGYGWRGYVMPKGTAPGSLPPSLSPADAFDKYPGHYLFGPREPDALRSDPAAFVKALYDFLAVVGQGNFVGRALLWLPGANLPAPQNFNSYGLRISLAAPSQVQNNLNLLLGNRLTFFVNYGTYVKYDPDFNALRLKSSTAISLGFSDKLQADSGLQLTPTQQPLAYVPLDGAQAGSLTYALSYSSVPALKYFKTGFAYVVNTASGPSVLNYPAFNPVGMPARLAMGGVLDPLDPLNQNIAPERLAAGLIRTGLSYAAPGSTALPSQWRSTAGNPINLIPLNGLDANGWPLPYAASLVFCDDGASYSLTLSGDYGLSLPAVPAATAGQNLLCGIFGTEWLSFTSYDPSASASANDRLRLLAAQPAYAPVFPFQTTSLVTPTSGAVTPLLTGAYRTAWSNLVAGASAPAYSAQPDGSPLYGQATTQGTTVLLAPAAPRTPLPQDAGFAFPLVPYAGMSSVAGLDLTQFESEILAASRKSLISAATLPGKQAARGLRLQRKMAANGAPPNRATTPQGLLVDLDADGIGYNKVLLARSQSNQGLLDFAFEQPTEALHEALQTNQLFLVGVNPQPFFTQGASFSNQLEIADWRFIANVGVGVQTTSYRNVLIMKYCSGSLKDRIDNPNRWTMPETFSKTADLVPGLETLAYTGLSQWLQDFIAVAEAKAASSPDSLYADFVAQVSDPGWNGFMVLNADLPLDSLPEQLAGIAAGIDYSRFLAHHFGASVSRVSHQGDTLDIQGISNLFGLIDYQNPAYEQARFNGADPDMPVALSTSDGYAFSVLQLQALFRQSKLQTFNSRIQLSLDSLFGSPILATLRAGQPSAVNAMVLDGSALQQNDTTTYVFEQSQNYLFDLDSNVLPAASVNRIQFNTLGSPDGGVTTSSRFLLWGKLDFTLLKTADGPFDLLSFGSADGSPDNQGLAYTNLQIGMAFPSATPNAVGFDFNPDNLGFDPVTSQVRGQSLYKGFTLQLKQFIQAPAQKKPADYGFLPVLPEGLALKALSGAWSGIVYKVTMGSPGALVSGTGFESDLLLAWSPGSKASDPNPMLFVGLSLPGAAPSASVFSLQGIIKVSTGPIKLLYQLIPGQKDSQDRFFNLQLTDIGIKILGIAKLPPGATLQFFLFGDPQNSGSLGWYAAYVKDPDSKTERLQALASDPSTHPVLAGPSEVAP